MSTSSLRNYPSPDNKGYNQDDGNYSINWVNNDKAIELPLCPIKFNTKQNFKLLVTVYELQTAYNERHLRRIRLT